MTTKLFVAGATGLTGRAAVEDGCRRGIATVAHVRPDSSSLATWRARFEAMGAEVDTTPWDEAQITETLRRHAPTAVLGLLGTTRKRAARAAKGGEDAGYEAVDYGLTAMLRRAAEACGHRPRFVYVSMVGAREGANAYTRVRGRIERELREGALPYAIARPSFIVGERDEGRAGEKIGVTVLDGALSVVSVFGGRKLAARYGSMTGDQLGRACVTMAIDPACENTIAEPDVLRRLAD